MSRQIDSDDRIANKTPPLNPADKTELNADNIMLILDKIVDGQYRWRCRQGTYDWIVNLPDKDPGEIFFATDTGQFVGWNGTSLVVLG